MKLVCTERLLPETVEDEIKEGFYEMRHKFKPDGASQVYISHLVLQAKHPLFAKLKVNTVRKILSSC